MKVLYFHQHFSTPSGSTGTRSYEMAQRLIARGHQVTMVCGSSKMANSGLSGEVINGARRGIVDGINVIELYLPYSNYDSLLKRSWIFFKFALRSVGLALRMDYNLLFATTTPLTAGIPGIFASVIRRKLFVFEVRDLWPELPREMQVITNPVVLFMLEMLEWFSYHAATACIGLSPGIVRGIVKRGINEKKVAMIPNGCDLDLFDPQLVEPVRPPGVSKNDFLAIFSGAHGLANGLEAVLNAAQVLKNRARDDIKLVFIGDGKLKPNLIQKATAMKLGNCLFLEPVSKHRLTTYLRGADAGLMILANVPAFYYGTSPNKFFDYIAIGLPVINNYPGWLAGIIEKYKCGLAVDPEKPEALADALEMLADDRRMAAIMGANARRLAIEQFSRMDLANQFVDYLEEVWRCSKEYSMWL